MKGAGKAHKELQEQQKKNLNNGVHNQTQGVNQRRAPGRLSGQLQGPTDPATGLVIWIKRKSWRTVSSIGNKVKFLFRIFGESSLHPRKYISGPDQKQEGSMTF